MTLAWLFLWSIPLAYVVNVIAENQIGLSSIGLMLIIVSSFSYFSIILNYFYVNSYKVVESIKTALTFGFRNLLNFFVPLLLFIIQFGFVVVISSILFGFLGFMMKTILVSVLLLLEK